MLQFPKKMHSPLALFDNPSDVLGQGESVQDLHSKELDTFHSQHCGATDAEGCDLMKVTV